MEKDPNNSATHSSFPINDEDAEKSFVGKFKSIINNTPLSKWFRKQEESRSTIRRRDDEAEDDEIHQMQPPSKRAKRPVSAEENNSVIFKTSDTISSLNIVEIQKEVNHFPEPVAGPSGIKSRKLLGSATISKNSVKNTYGNSDLLNGHKDSDSEESTSGYSSVARIGSKEHVCHSQESSKQASPMQNNSSNTRSLFQSTPMSRSLFADRNLSPNPNSSMTSRRPAFNASTFGSPNFIDNTITTEKIINSPFYNGRTIYGGASAYGRRLGRSVRDLRTSLKKSVQIKPVNKSNENGNLMLGKTARRILETLEQYSSPVNDAKKIPVTSKRFRPDGYVSQHVGANPFLVRGNEVPSNKELQVPTVSDLLKMKQKMRLQQSTEVVRQIAISSKSDLNTETSDKSTNGSKKSKILENKIAKKQKRDTEVIKDQGTSSTPSLPTTALPKFEVVIPPEPATKRKPMKFFSTIVSPPVSVASKPKPPCETVETVKNKQTDKPSTDNGHFKFSDPLIISANLKSIVAINNFKFSEPLRDIGKSNSSKSSDNEKLTGSAQLLKSIPKDQTCLTEPQKPAAGEPEHNKPVNSDGQKNFGDKFKMSTDKWECGVCMVRNEDKDNKCVACTTPKPLPKSATPKPAGVGNSAAIPPSFGDKFKMPSNMWECPVCMIRNENSRTKCSACETPNTKSTPATPTLGFGTKFQGPSNTWECTTCLIRNKEDAVKCVACETPKVGKKSTADSLGSLFKKKEDEWECAVCMVRNKSSNLKCQCCEAIKPGSAPNSSLLQGDADKKPLPKFNFGIDKAVANSFSFGIPPSETKSLPKPAVDPATVFGATAKPTAQVGTFSFGVASEPKESSEKVEPPKPAIEKTVTVLPTVPVKTTEKPDKEPAVPASSKVGFSIPTSTAQSSLVVPKSKEESTFKLTTTANESSSNNAKPLFSFSSVQANKDKPADQAGSMTKEVSSNPPPAKLFNFGAKPVAPATTQAAPHSVVQTKDTTKPTTSMPIFSFTSNKTATDPASPMFGAAKASPLNNGISFPNTSTFGNISKASMVVPPSNSTDIKPFSFGSSATTEEPAKKAAMFSFGPSATPAQPAQTQGGFNFAAPNPTANPPSFNFSTGTAAASSFNVPSTNIFGANAAAGNNTKSAGFNFGSTAQNSNSQKAGFSFGAPMNNSSTVAPTAPPTGFNFGAPAAAAPGGFNFSEAASGFGSDKPSFNFTGGSVTAFTAPPCSRWRPHSSAEKDTESHPSSAAIV
ncbi:hypothetical protein JTB14_015648 [Gonioctena quinquepunctata]|nr:hypothetical protein JTB14_015648 [Gonioctena quinquepunctata]